MLLLMVLLNFALVHRLRALSLVAGRSMERKEEKEMIKRLHCVVIRRGKDVRRWRWWLSWIRCLIDAHVVECIAAAAATICAFVCAEALIEKSCYRQCVCVCVAMAVIDGVSVSVCRLRRR